MQLASRLAARGEVLAARDCLDFLSQAPDPPPELLVAQASLRFDMGEVAVAKTLMDRAVAAGIETPGDHHLYYSRIPGLVFGYHLRIGVVHNKDNPYKSPPHKAVQCAILYLIYFAVQGLQLPVLILIEMDNL